MQQRKGTEAQWISTNNGNGPVLNPGEIGYEIDTNKFKIGDGVSHWVDLNYFADEVALGGNIDDYIPLTQRGTAGGVATLNGDGVIPSEQIPSLVGLDTEIADAVSLAVNNLVDSAPGALNTLNELAAAIGDDANYASTVTNALALKAPINNPTFTGTVAGVTKAHVGLENVDNSSDADKPVSTATQTALDLKAPLESPTFTGTVSGVTKAHVGLSDVDNTSDADKPVSNATATALNLKQDASTAAASAVESVFNKLADGTGIDITQDPTTKVITVAVDSTIATEGYVDTAVTGLATETYVDTAIGNIDALPSQTGNAGEFLTTDGTTASWATVDLSTKANISNPEFTTGNAGERVLPDYTGSQGVFPASQAINNYGHSIAASGYQIGYGSNIPSGWETYIPSNMSFFVGKVAVISGGEHASLQGEWPILSAAVGPQNQGYPISLALGGGFTWPTEAGGASNNNATIYIKSANTLKTVSSTELGYLDGVTSGIQGQIDLKSPIASPTFTGTVTTDDLVVDGDFTVNGTNFSASATSITIEDNMVQLAHQNAANTVDLGLVVAYNDGAAKHAGIVRDVSDAKWKLFKDVTTEPSTVVAFGEGSLDALAVGAFEASSATVASDTVATLTATQTLTNKTLTNPKIVAEINAQTSSYTLVSGDASDFVEVSSSSATTVTVPTNSSVAYPVGTTIHIVQTGSGQITVAGAGGVTVNGTPGLKLRTQWSAATLVKRATDTWVLFGDLTA